MERYRKRIEIIEAIQWDGEYNTIKSLLPIENVISAPESDRVNKTLTLHTMDCNYTAHIGDWITKNKKGECHVLNSILFERIYEPMFKTNYEGYIPEKFS